MVRGGRRVGVRPSKWAVVVLAVVMESDKGVQAIAQGEREDAQQAGAARLRCGLASCGLSGPLALRMMLSRCCICWSPSSSMEAREERVTRLPPPLISASRSSRRAASTASAEGGKGKAGGGGGKAGF